MIEVIEIKEKKDFVAFVEFPFKLYKNNPFWVPPMKAEELTVIDKKQNPVFNNATAAFYLARIDGEVVGRVAAMINWIEVNSLQKKKVRFGWFDVIDDVNVSKALIEAVKDFGKAAAMEFMEGPVGFSNLDKAGMLVEGFEEMNTMITQYNYPYYSQHMEQLGLEKLAQWVEYEIKITSFEESPEKVRRFGELMLDRYKLKVLHFTKTKQILPYVEQMFTLLEETYNKLQTFVPIQPYQIKHYKEKYFRYIHPEFIKCVADEQGKLVAFVIIMPSFTQALKKANGKMFPWGIFHILKAQYFNHRASFYLIGVHPDYQNKGVTAVIFNEVQKLFNKKGITVVETNPELEENDSIQNMWKNYAHRLHKKRATYTTRL
ncbi:MAG: GNAT family N-acetyltransferase [Flavobacteriaceae bacterium]|nr:GNAT family N-acetyltransferase [Flavobacteriaceae bacterium]